MRSLEKLLAASARKSANLLRTFEARRRSSPKPPPSSQLRRTSWRRRLVLVMLLLVWSCTAQEEQVLTTFFDAVQQGDQGAAARIALADFPGTVESWELVEIGPESQSRFTLSEMYAKLRKKQRELRIESEKNGYFRSDHRDLFAEYQKSHAENPEQKFTGELGEFQAEWAERMKRQGELEKEVEALDEQLKALRSAAGLSVNTSVNENFVGDVKRKDVRIKVNDGSSEKIYTVELERYDLVDEERNLTPIAKWIIADIQESA